MQHQLFQRNERINAPAPVYRKQLVGHFAETTASTAARYGSIRELVTPQMSPCKRIGLAHIAIDPGEESPSEYHQNSEEVDYVLSGIGLIQVGGTFIRVRCGDVVCIPPGTPHAIRNLGDTPLGLLVTMAPPLDKGQEM